MATQSGDIAVQAGDREDSTTTTPPKERLHRVNTLPTSGYEVGGVYFVRSEGKIYIRTESGWECFDKASEADTASQATAIKVRAAAATDDRPIPFSALGTASKTTLAPALDANFTYNKSTQTLNVPNVVSSGLNANSGKIINVANPTASTDAANKAYVDSKISGGGSGSSEKQWVITSQTTSINDPSIWSELATFSSNTTKIPNIWFIDEWGHAFPIKYVTTGEDQQTFELYFSGIYEDAPDEIQTYNISVNSTKATLTSNPDDTIGVVIESYEDSFDNLINSTSGIVRSIKINGTTKTPNSNGLVDLGTISGGGSVTTDTSMSSTSTNPVQNKVIKSYVDSLVGTAITQLAAI